MTARRRVPRSSKVRVLPPGGPTHRYRPRSGNAGAKNGENSPLKSESSAARNGTNGWRSGIRASGMGRPEEIAPPCTVSCAST